MIYYLYKITNKLNGKIYIGVHETDNLEDGYMGSGKAIISAIKKYGKENFTKEIMEFFDNREAMYLRESNLVSSEFCQDNMNYNMAPGGKGGTIILNRSPFSGPHTEETKNKIRLSLLGRIPSAETRMKISKNNFSKRNPIKQKEHAIKAGKKRAEMYIRTPELKEKISQTLTGKKHNKISCPHCHTFGGERAMKRYHFDNCKMLP
jgi:group I intron endonuclease